MTPSPEYVRKAMLASEMKTLAEKGCGNCYAQDCNWPECSPKAKALKEEMTAKPAPLRDSPPCNPHPDAPHGFDRNASHSAGRYVCDCEGWVDWSAA